LRVLRQLTRYGSRPTRELECDASELGGASS
jgi:hypothetical protein